MNKLLLALSVLFLIGCASPGVIGVGYNKEGIVKHVFKNSPADNAGLMIGDRILNPKELRGKIGTIANIKIARGNNVFTVQMVRQDIDKLNYETYKW